MEPSPTPLPNIRLCCVSVVIELDPSSDCYVQGELQPNNIGANLKAEFGFRRSLNTVDADVIVKILEGEDVIISARYLFPPAPSPLPGAIIIEATQSLEASGLSCNIRSEVITVRLEIEPV